MPRRASGCGERRDPRPRSGDASPTPSGAAVRIPGLGAAAAAAGEGTTTCPAPPHQRQGRWCGPARGCAKRAASAGAAGKGRWRGGSGALGGRGPPPGGGRDFSPPPHRTRTRTRTVLSELPRNSGPGVGGRQFPVNDGDNGGAPKPHCGPGRPPLRRVAAAPARRWERRRAKPQAV